MGNKIENIIVINGIMTNQSPLIIGKGKGDLIDIEILKEENSIPYIPATSFIGAVKHHLEKYYEIDNNNEKNKKIWEYFWGSQDIQSHFIIKNLRLKNKVQENTIAIRDGIRIDNKTGIAEDKAKYNYETVQIKCEFVLNGEIKVTEGINLDYLLIIIKTIIKVLKECNIHFGAMTSKGFGRLKLEEIEVILFEFPKDGEKYFEWLDSGFSSKIYNISTISELKKKRLKEFVIKVNLEIKSSLIIGSYKTDPTEPDKVNIRFNKNPVITGTAIKGAIRSRAEKIINTFGKNGKEILRKTFGWIDEKGIIKKKYKSKVIIEEILANKVIEKVQTRIKIDRFTGGVMDGALLEMKPIWHGTEDLQVKITLEDFEEWEAGLLLLIIKDLWTSDLPIGGEKAIGRGVLMGKKAEIKYNGKNVLLIETNGKIQADKESKKKLEKLIDKFLEKMGV